MELRLSRAEYWLLETVVESKYPLYVVGVGSEDVDQFCLNKPSHGLPATRIIDTLARLFDRGWLVASQCKGDASRPLNRQEIDLAVVQPTSSTAAVWYFGLTKAGGAVWEAFAAPNWDWFLDGRLGAEDAGEFIGASEEWLKRYFELVHYLGCRVRPGSEHWDEVRPWQATYWKELPVGYRVRFECTWETPDMEVVPHQVMFLRDGWYRWR